MTYAEALAHLFRLGPELAPSTPGAPRRKFDLAHMRTLCRALGNPQDQVPSVLIAGTNGKGSTAATLASILASAGYRTGLYTSPHLIRVNERIQLSGNSLRAPFIAPSSQAMSGSTTPNSTRLTPISDEDFATLYTEVETTCAPLVESGQLPHQPSFFERLTATAFLYFARQQADIMILEVGLGGRLDATNIVEPLLSVITDIALDHQEWLGDTITQIAGEKAGILRPHGTLITLPQHPEANTAIGLAATALEVTAINAAEYLPEPLVPHLRDSFIVAKVGPATEPPTPSVPHLRDSLIVAKVGPATETPPSVPHLRDSFIVAKVGIEQSSTALLTPPQPSPLHSNHYTLTINNHPIEIDSPLPGQHQQRNLALALAAALELRNQKGYNIPNPAIEAGVRNTQWPGRLEFLPPNLLLDVAHNPAGAWTLRAAIAALPPAQPRTFIFSCLRDKSLTEMSRILFPLFDSTSGDPNRSQDHILLAPISSPRAAHVDDLLAAAHALDIPAHAAPHLAGALAQARRVTPPGGLIIATGSVYLVGEIRALATEGSPS